MTFRTLILRSLRFHARAHLGVVLGAAVGSAALIGALVVGDSVRGSLKEMALRRLGKIQYALAPNDRFFSAELAEAFGSGSSKGRVRQASDRPEPTSATSALRLPATASAQNGADRANHVQVIGVSDGFSNVGGSSQLTHLTDDGVALNEALAAQLNAHAGDAILLRIRKPSALSQDAVISPKSESSVALRLRVQVIVPANGLGNFNLAANQIPPLNAFLKLDVLASRAGIPGRANLLLVESLPKSTSNAVSRLDSMLRDFLSLSDLELELRDLPGQGMVELRSSRIFLDAPIVRATRLASVGAAADSPANSTNYVDLLTYFVNQLSAGERAAPYSMVSAMGAPVVPADMHDDEILINQWLADDLQIGPGADLALAYFLADSGARLVERTNHFRVRAVVPMTLPYADRTLVPDFPGIAKAESTHNWDAGFPLVHTIRDQDDKYWKQWRGTPKAFITLAAGQKIWANRFGDLTAVRFLVPTNTTPPEVRGTLERKLLREFKPDELGLRFKPVCEQAEAAANQAQDFGQLFLGFSFFLILAALILMALLFQFGLEQRISEVGTLLALGFTPKQVRRLLLAEGAALALVGGIIGVLGGIGYARVMLVGLKTIWRDAVGTSALQFHLTAPTLVIGLFSSVVVSAMTIWLVLRKQARRPARELLAGGEEGERPRGEEILPLTARHEWGEGREEWHPTAGAKSNVKEQWMALLSPTLSSPRCDRRKARRVGGRRGRTIAPCLASQPLGSDRIRCARARHDRMGSRQKCNSRRRNLFRSGLVIPDRRPRHFGDSFWRTEPISNHEPSDGWFAGSERMHAAAQAEFGDGWPAGVRQLSDRGHRRVQAGCQCRRLQAIFRHRRLLLDRGIDLARCPGFEHKGGPGVFRLGRKSVGRRGCASFTRA